MSQVSLVEARLGAVSEGVSGSDNGWLWSSVANGLFGSGTPGNDHFVCRTTLDMATCLLGNLVGENTGS